VPVTPEHCACKKAVDNCGNIYCISAVIFALKQCCYCMLIIAADSMLWLCNMECKCGHMWWVIYRFNRTVIIILWLALEWTLSFPQATYMQEVAHGKHFSWDVPGSSLGKRGQVGWQKTRRIDWNHRYCVHVRIPNAFTESNPDSSIEYPLSGGLHSPLASEDFSWQQPVPPDCCILVRVEDSNER